MIRLRCENQNALGVAQDAKRGPRFVSSLRSSFGTGLTHPLARDLLRIGQSAFLADRAFRRGSRLGQQMRTISVTLPVENPEQWVSISSDVARLAEFVSHDRWEFDFIPSKQLISPRTAKERQLRFPQSPCIHLFSNGLDSLCGLAAAFRRGELPVLVSHSPPGWQHVFQKTRSLIQRMGLKQSVYFFNFYFKVSDKNRLGKRALFPERSRRTRPMLYLCMAGAVAIELGIARICLNENGVLAVNLPFAPHLNGPQISRHAHPETLRRFERILNAVWPYKSIPVVENPFSRNTKGEEMASLGRAIRMAEETVTCEFAGQQVANLKRWFRTNSQSIKECGLCMPCLIRRAAMQFAGVREASLHYAFNDRLAYKEPMAYSGTPLYETISSHVRNLYAFCLAIKKMKPSDFVVRYAYELSLAYDLRLSAGEQTKDLYRMYRRFANEFLQHIEAS